MEERVRIWVADEHRYGLIPVVRSCWSLRGLRPVAPYQTKYEWSYLYRRWKSMATMPRSFFACRVSAWR